MTFQIRQLSAADYPLVISVIDQWWSGRQMADKLPRLFFEHFTDTSFAAEHDGKLAGFLAGFISQSRPGEACHPGQDRTIYQKSQSGGSCTRTCNGARSAGLIASVAWAPSGGAADIPHERAGQIAMRVYPAGSRPGRRDVPVMDRGDHLAGASRSARQASVMPAIPMRPASPTTGRCRKCPPDAAAARWSSGPAVDSAGRMTSATAGRACGCTGGCCAEAPVMTAPFGRILTGSPERSGQITGETGVHRGPAFPARLPGRPARPCDSRTSFSHARR